MYTFDGFPVESLSVEHACIFSASLTNFSQSEEFLRIITAATIKSNAEVNRMHTNRRTDRDFNAVSCRDCFEVDGEDVHAKLLITADKKALEVFIGRSPGCLWCDCPVGQRLKAAWKLSDREPTTWSDASARLHKVCAHPFPTIFKVYALAHLALPHEKLPRYCPVCKKKPYETEEEYEADLAAYAAARADTTKQGKSRFRAARSLFAGLRPGTLCLLPCCLPLLTTSIPLHLHVPGAHQRQYKHEAPNLIINTERIIPEIMHLDNLNVAKQCWTKGIMPLMSDFMREVTTTFFKNMNVKLDVKSKSDGRAGSAWFKASAWAEMVNGSNKVPGGLGPWLSSLLFHIGADFLERQPALAPVHGT